MGKPQLAIATVILGSQIILAGAVFAADMQAKINDLNAREKHLIEKLEAVQQRAKDIEKKLAAVRQRKQDLLDKQALRQRSPSPAVTPSAAATP